MPFFYRSQNDAPRITRSDLELPQLVLKQRPLERNLSAMRQFCDVHGVSIAPHVKTTMAPSIITRQLMAGAWGATVANMQQLRVCLDMGVPRILIANELVNPEAFRWLGEAMRGTNTDVVHCLVDSRAAVEHIAAGWGASGHPDPLGVLVELGSPGGRAGCRTRDEVGTVAAAVRASAALRLVGVEGFEGILGRTRSDDDLNRVDAYLADLGECASHLDGLGYFADTEEVILSAGGSLYFDRVAATLGAVSLSRPTRVVLRSGCYVTHDHGSYGGTPPMAAGTRHLELTPALELWAEVLSIPEGGRAIAGFGRRDAPFDAGLPVVVARLSPSQEVPEARTDVVVTGLNDQHAYVEFDPASRLEVGDRIICGIIHPCTAFDKWRRIPLVDDEYRIQEIIETAFS